MLCGAATRCGLLEIEPAAEALTADMVAADALTAFALAADVSAADALTADALLATADDSAWSDPPHALSNAAAAISVAMRFMEFLLGFFCFLTAGKFMRARHTL